MKKNKFVLWLRNELEPFDFMPENDKEVSSDRVESIKKAETEVHTDTTKLLGTVEVKFFYRVYYFLSALVCAVIISTLLITVSYLPRLGSSENPHNNEVSDRYVESGTEETGAVNTVAGMILDYRAFDTFGESCVLFTAVCCVFILLRKSAGEKALADENDRIYEPKNDTVLQTVVSVVTPFSLILGVYIILNGHLSAGGGFSGGAVMGTGIILYLLAFGFKKTERFFTEKTFKVITCSALIFYCLAKSYSFFTGANGIESGIPLGTPGDILSSGLILPLNICVGLIVACTVYALYVSFRKGGF